jgi:predicted thioredoxin/glutaredoxin
MTTQDTLRVVREMRQELRTIQNGLESLREREEIDWINVDEAISHVGFAIDELTTTAEKVVRETMEFYKEANKREGIGRIMEGLSDA